MNSISPLGSGNTEMSADVIVVGGGPIGLAAAWRVKLTAPGLDVIVIDPKPGSGAADVAAGMLAPATEVHYGEDALARLGLASSQRWPSFAAELRDAADLDIGYSEQGAIVVAYDADDYAVLDDLFAYQQRLNLPVTRLRSREARHLEPMLSPSIRGGMLAESDHHVDPRALCRALATAGERAGVRHITASAREIVMKDGRIAGVVIDDDRFIAAPTVVLAAGVWSAAIDGLPAGARPPVRPVKGQVVTLQGAAGQPLIDRAVRGLVKGTSVYLVPRPDGRLVIGATMEEKGWDTESTAGGVYELLRDATLLVPGISELTLCEVRAGLRPGTPDNGPLVGTRAGLSGLIYATGHFRNGILLTPTTADAVARCVAGEAVSPEMGPFTPERFASAAAEAGGL